MGQHGCHQTLGQRKGHQKTTLRNKRWRENKEHVYIRDARSMQCATNLIFPRVVHPPLGNAFKDDMPALQHMGEEGATWD